METVYSILRFVYCVAMVLLLFNLTIFVHEYGHYLLARWRGLKVETFAIWFGPALWKRRIRGIDYVLGSIPLGGYVKLPQLQPDDPIEGKTEVPKEHLPYARPIDRIPTLFAGSLFNFLFAILVACVLWVVGIPVPKWMTDTTIGYVPAESVEANAGLREGDEIIAVNGRSVDNWLDIRNDVALSSSADVRLTVMRDGDKKIISLFPGRDNLFGIRQLETDPSHTPVVGGIVSGSPAEQAGLLPQDKILSFDGIKILSTRHLIHLVKERPDKSCPMVVDRHGSRVTLQITPRLVAGSQAVRIGAELQGENAETVLLHPTPYQQITEVVLQMAQIINAVFHHKETGVGLDDFAGPIGIFDRLYTAVASDIRHALGFLILLNVNLAILNLLPLPVLDGGHIMFTILEWVRKKPLNPKFMEVVQTTFVILLLAFVLYVSFNDVKRLPKLHGWFSQQQDDQSAPAGSDKTNAASEAAKP